MEKNELRILHCWDQAGVAALIAEYQRRLGHEAVVVKRYGFDGLSIGKFYGTHTIPALPHRRVQVHAIKKILGLLRKTLRFILKQHRTLKFFITVGRLAKGYNVLHVHSIYKLLFFTPFQPKIFEFHGDDVRRTPSFKNPIDKLLIRLFLLIFQFSQNFYVSTPDLLNVVARSKWIPNPVDTEHFAIVTPRKQNGKALYIHNWYETSNHANKLAAQNGWKLTILDRAGNENVQYEDMPGYLVQFEFFIDRYAIHSLSKTALEALALGLKVVKWNDAIVEGLPERHEPENVAKRTLEIYKEVLK